MSRPSPSTNLRVPSSRSLNIPAFVVVDNAPDLSYTYGLPDSSSAKALLFSETTTL